MAKSDRVAAYIGALGLRAVTVRPSDAGPFSKLGFTGEFRQRPPKDAPREFWFAKPAHAELVAMTCRDDLAEIGAMRDKGWIDLDAAHVADKIINTAALIGAPWKTAKEINELAAAAVAEIERKIEAARVAGALKSLNSSYKNYRAATVARGEPAKPYSAYLGAFTVDIVRAAAGQSRETFGIIAPIDAAVAHALRSANHQT